MLSLVKPKETASANVRRRPSASQTLRARGLYTVVCRRPDGSVRWEEQAKNLIVTTGLDYILTNGLVTPSLHLGLVSDTPTFAAGDTMSSHAGWTEFTAYDEATRQAWTEGGTSSGVMTNSGSVASFTISTNSSVIAGLFLTSDNTKSGTSGTLISAVAFTGGDKAADDGDTLEVTYQITLADDGA